MSRHQAWKSTPLGRLAGFIGSVKFAVPSLALTAAAMGWGTYVDSTVGRAAAMERVYGSWWFIALMACICASLILSVAVRYPWRRKHVGFIIVHASLIALIGIGFFTMYTKVEGRIVLAEGEDNGGKMLLDARWVELLEPREQQYASIDHVVLDNQTTITLGSTSFQITDFWANSGMTRKITNDNPLPLHAIEILSLPGQVEADWVGQIDNTAPAPMLNDFAIRVVPVGQTWEPPETTDDLRIVFVDASGNEIALPEPGSEIGTSGWTLSEYDEFERAIIGEGGVISERETGPANGAIRAVITHHDGSVEQLVAFEKMRDSPFPKLLKGETASGLILTYRGETFSQPTLAVMRTEDGHIHAVYAKPNGTVVSYRHTGTWPWTITVAGKPVTILQDFDRARASQQLEQRPPMGDSNNSPALVVTPVDGGIATPLRWNTPTPVIVGDKTFVLRYGEMTMDLPFRLRLLDFRKMDYPGSEMAMAFESDVTVSPDQGEPFDFKIHMNHPYKQDGWKVYQSGFLNDSITVLQVTKDPGLVPMYLACITLCLGILITFYSRSLSWGHPDIPMPFGPKAANKKQGAE